MFINWKARELNLKIVYYGPAMSGKTTNLQYVHAKTNPTLRSDLVSLKTREDRTIFFDFLQIELSPIKGLKPKFQLYTVPGQTYYLATRKVVLQGCDGVVFVADSQTERMSENCETLENLHTNLRDLGLASAHVPIIYQFNKRDLPNTLTLDALRLNLGLNGAPCFPAAAAQGLGVFETLKAAINAVALQVQTRI
ncbi:MAG: GTPase domain-containing protein [Chloroflexi bacterium]|nr:GTPase domain-containing protein [Chloroflexota bacterium]